MNGESMSGAGRALRWDAQRPRSPIPDSRSQIRICRKPETWDAASETSCVLSVRALAESNREAGLGKRESNREAEKS